MTSSTTAYSSNDVQWQELRSRYDQGRINEALQLLLKEDHPAYYYNLGTLYYQMDQIGKAVAYLEKANKLNQTDKDIQYNLETARTALRKKLGERLLDPGASPMDWISDQAHSPKVQALFALLTLIVTLAGFRRYWLTQDLTEWSTGLLSGTGLFLLLTLIALTRFPHILGAQSAAVALERQSIRSGPGDQFLELTQIEAGTKVRLTGESINGTSGTSTLLWHQVRFSGDGIGWIKDSEFLFL